MSPLTRLLSLPSHHAAFRGVTGLAKNAKSLWNGQKKVTAVKRWTDGHSLSNDGLYSTLTQGSSFISPPLKRHKIWATWLTKEIQNLDFLFKEENTYRKSCCKDKSHFCLLMHTIQLISCARSQYSSVSAPGLSPKSTTFKKSKFITPE